jgi:hypothetical protein
LGKKNLDQEEAIENTSSCSAAVSNASITYNGDENITDCWKSNLITGICSSNATGFGKEIEYNGDGERTKREASKNITSSTGSMAATTTTNTAPANTMTCLNVDHDNCSNTPETPKEVTKEQHVCSSLEKKLFHSLHSREIRSPTVKEFKECWSFANTVRSFLGKDTSRGLKVVIDVAGGHGALGALFLLLTSATRAVVIDPARVGQGGVEKAWGPRYRASGKELVYRHECLRSGLRKELEALLSLDHDGNGMLLSNQILVVACHACQHLTDETLDIACSYGVHVAVMPCCQKDPTGGSWKAVGKALGLDIAPLMDLLTCGKVMSSFSCCWWNNNNNNCAADNSFLAGKNTPQQDSAPFVVKYQVRMKMIPSCITPQNRIILCKAMIMTVQRTKEEENCRVFRVTAAHEKLQRAYQRAHAKQLRHHRKEQQSDDAIQNKSSRKIHLWQQKQWPFWNPYFGLKSLQLGSGMFCIRSAMIGVAFGVMGSIMSCTAITTIAAGVTGDRRGTIKT